jgi:2-polyprenyl-3-methyl-5-hydroxy-6-metoxy-1,4-benzoquinol methylase
MESEKERIKNYSHIYEQNIAYGAEEKINTLNAEYTINRIKGPVIELGCGNGTWTNIIIRKFGSVTVVDASSELLKKIKNRHGSNAICEENLFEQYYPNSQNFSTVLLIGALHHSYEPEKILKNIAKWIHPEAKLVVSVPNADSIHRRLGTKMGLISSNEDLSTLGIKQGHQRIYTKKFFINQLANAGFTIDFFKGLFFKPFSNSQMDIFDDAIFSGLFNLAEDLPDDSAAILYAECTKRP